MISSRRRSTLLLLCLFFGCFGAHRFYTGKKKTAIVQLLTLGGMGVWSAIDFIFIACGGFKDKDGQAVIKW